MYQACIKIAVALLLLVGTAQAAEQAYQEGQHYDKIDLSILANENIKQHIAQDHGKIQVIEFFSYGCAWCGQVHEPIEKWAATKKNVVLYNYPAVFNHIWRDLAKLYFAVQQCDNSIALNEIIFNSIHEKHLPVWQEPVFNSILSQNGVDLELFKQHLHSLITDSKLRKAETLAGAYKIDSTPYIIIHGPHGSYFTSLTKTMSKDALIDVVDYLVNREQKFLQKA
jgi:protein-disulfide isomerase